MILFLKALGSPKEAQKGSPKYNAGVGRCNQPFWGPCWAHLGLSYGLIGLVHGVPGGILRHHLILEGPSRCQEVRKGYNSKNMRNLVEINLFEWLEGHGRVGAETCEKASIAKTLNHLLININVCGWVEGARSVKKIETVVLGCLFGVWKAWRDAMAVSIYA